MKALTKSEERKYGVVLNYVQIALHVVFSIAYTPLMLRLLGKNEYGLYGTVMSFIGLLDLLTMGFGNSYIKFYSKFKIAGEHNRINSFNALYTSVFFVIASIALAIGIFFSFNLGFVFDKGLTADEYSKARVMMILLTLSTAICFGTTVILTFIQAEEKFVFTKAVQVVSNVLIIACNLIVLFRGYGAIGLLVVSLVFTVLIRVIYSGYAFKKLHLKFDFKHIEKGLFKQVFAFSALIAINMVVDKVNQGIDNVLLGRFCGTAAVATYSVAASLNSFFVSFSTSISGIFVPKVHNLVNSYETDSKEQRKALTDFFVKVGRLQFILMALIASGIVFFGKPFFRFWAGEGYDKSYYIALLLIIPSVIPLTQNVCIEIQRALNRHHYRSYIYGLTAILNLVSSYFLCQKWEGIGCAIGTAGATIIATIIIMNIVYDKKININVADYWKNILRMLLGMIIPFAVGAGIMHFVDIDSIIKLIFYIGIYSVIYVVFVYFLSTNDYEKRLVKSLLKKIKILK